MLRHAAIAGPVFLTAVLLVACDQPMTGPASGSPRRLLPTSASPSVSPPTFNSATFFGGSGSQRGNALAIGSGGIFVAGNEESVPSALTVRYALPPSAPSWSHTVASSYWLGVTQIGGTAYPVGVAIPSTCGASDGNGDTEGKSAIARYTSSGTFLGCSSPNYFPYRGIELYLAATATTEGGADYVYASAWAEQTGFSFSFLFVLTKYDAAGTIVGSVTEPGVTLGSFSGCCPGESNMPGITHYSGDIFLAGMSRLPGFLEDNNHRPVLMRYTPALARVWKSRLTDRTGTFLAVAASGGYLYAVGMANALYSSGSDFLIEKYDANGNRIWSAISGGSDEDILTGVVLVGGRLFAAGRTRSSGSGGADVVLLEIDPATGATLSTTLFGGALDDMANGVATDGNDLYVVGESRSFATADGNAVGQNDVILLHYLLELTVAIDIKPGTFPNSINPTKKGNTPVAVLTANGFDAATVDVTSVRFGATGTEAAPVQSALQDVDGDGDVDLILHFATLSTGIPCGAPSAVLTGQTLGGQPIRGSDSVVTSGCK